MNVRLVCAFASNSCIGTEPAAYVEENVKSENTDFRPVNFSIISKSRWTVVVSALDNIN